MTDSASNELFHILKAFSPAMRSVDVRTVAISPNLGEPWQNLITSIIISEKTEGEVKDEHKRLPTIRNNNQFKIFLKTSSFDYDIFGEIFEGEIKFLTHYGRNRIQIRKCDPLNLKVESFQEWKDGTSTWMLRAFDNGLEEERDELWKIVDKQKRLPKTLNAPNIPALIERYLRIKYSDRDRKDLEIVIPCPVEIGDISFSENEVEVKVKNPEKMKALQLNLNVEHNFRPIWQDFRVIGENISESFVIKALSPFDKLDVELIHRDSGLTLDKRKEKAPLKDAAEPFVKTLNTFCALDKFEKMLFEPEKYGRNPQKIFENAVTWLLSLAGYDTIHLGVLITKLNGKTESFDVLNAKSGVPIGCADIIAYEENERILLIDCTIGSVDEIKVQRLAETKKVFREELKGFEKLPIVPILFTTKDFRKSLPSPDVMIADQTTIKKIFEAIAQGEREKARSFLYYSGL